MSIAADWRLAIAVGAAAGLAVAPFWNPGGAWFRPLTVLVLVSVLLVERGRFGCPAAAMVGLAACLVGLLVGGARIEAIDGGALRASPGPVELSGFVLEMPSGTRGTLRFAVDTEQGRVLAEVQADRLRRILPGTGIDLSGRLGPAPDWMRADLERRGIQMVLRVDQIRLNGTRRQGVAGWIDRLRERAFSALEVAVPPREAALSRGFVLGEDSMIDQRTTEDFRRSGLGHLLAVSGQNIVLLALLAIPFLSLAGTGPRARLVVIAALIVIYVPLAGGGPSIQRAGVMGLAGLAALAATRAPSRLYALALAALVTLTLNPRATGDIGWQLSFAAVAGIMLMSAPLQLRLASVIGHQGWRRALAEGIAVTVAATVATLPLMAVHFENLPVATLFANLAAMPAVAPAMWAGMISIAVGQFSPTLAAPFNLAGSVFLGWLAQVAEWFGRPAWAVAELGSTGPITTAILVLAPGLLVVVLLRLWPANSTPLRPGRWLPVAAAVLLVLVLTVPDLVGTGRRQLAPPPANGLRVEFLDIGQGDAILVRPSESNPVLIDGGPPGGDLIGALDSAGIERLAAVILTHPDLDHFGGLPDLFGRVEVDRLLVDRAPPELVNQARSGGSGIDRLVAGDVIRMGETSLEILWPPHDGASVFAGGSETDTNRRSIVALLRWRNFRMLLTGDAEAESVPMHPGPIDVLKVAHHGSQDTGLPALLDETMPRLAVIQVGEENRYGHPVREVLDALNDDGVETLRTDDDGTVSIVLGQGPGFEVETGR